MLINNFKDIRIFFCHIQSDTIQKLVFSKEAETIFKYYAMIAKICTYVKN